MRTALIAALELLYQGFGSFWAPCFAAIRRTMGTSGTPIPCPSKSSANVTRDRVLSLTGWTVMLACALIDPATRESESVPAGCCVAVVVGARRCCSRKMFGTGVEDRRLAPTYGVSAGRVRVPGGVPR